MRYVPKVLWWPLITICLYPRIEGTHCDQSMPHRTVRLCCLLDTVCDEMVREGEALFLFSFCHPSAWSTSSDQSLHPVSWLFTHQQDRLCENLWKSNLWVSVFVLFRFRVFWKLLILHFEALISPDYQEAIKNMSILRVRFPLFVSRGTRLVNSLP